MKLNHSMILILIFSFMPIVYAENQMQYICVIQIANEVFKAIKPNLQDISLGSGSSCILYVKPNTKRLTSLELRLNQKYITSSGKTYHDMHVYTYDASEKAIKYIPSLETSRIIALLNFIEQSTLYKQEIRKIPNPTRTISYSPTDIVVSIYSQNPNSPALPQLFFKLKNDKVFGFTSYSDLFRSSNSKVLIKAPVSITLLTNKRIPLNLQVKDVLKYSDQHPENKMAIKIKSIPPSIRGG